MASVSFDVIFRPTPNQNVESFSQDEKEPLFKKPIIVDKKPKAAGSVQKAVVEEDTVGDFSLEDLALGYTELETRLDKNLDRISNQSQGLTYTFNPFDLSDLTEAISAIFKGVSGFISFDMYRQALELDRDLAILLGEAEHGLT